MSYVIGVDIGGTFTDCIVIKKEANSTVVKIGKSSSTPPDFQTGFIDAMRVAAQEHNIDLHDMLSNAEGIYHGCTVGTNALVEKRTAKVGLITTQGHRDALFMMRGGERLKWQNAEYIAHVSAQEKPESLIPKDLCLEVNQRTTFDGNILVDIDEDEVRTVVRHLIESGVESIAVSFLWSTANDEHEKKVRKIIHEISPETFVSLSSEVISRVGEYERMIATIINSLIGPPMDSYLKQLETDLRVHGYKKNLQLMSCSGGLIDASQARHLPVLTVGSGPVAGLIGATNLANNENVSGGSNVITADMGGTTLDIGIISQGQPLSRSTASYGQYEYFVPTLDVRSIGSGGGSIIHSSGDLLHVGPRSAGARPGPACYGRGGVEPTVADANLVLGYLNPDYFLGGKIKLDKQAAIDALENVGQKMGFDAAKTAASAIRIVDSQMADAIRLASIQQGYDARDFTLYAYGGAGAVHGTAIAKEIGINTVVIPLSNFAAGWSAFGIAASDALIVKESACAMTTPFDTETISARWRALESEAVSILVGQGVDPEKIVIEKSADMRYSMQVNQIEVKANPGEFNAAAEKEILKEFELEYERLFGKGSGYSKAGVTLSSIKVRAKASLSDLKISAVNASSASSDAFLKGERPVIWYEKSLQPEMTPVYDGRYLASGQEIVGPAIIEYPDTTIILRHGNVATLDAIGCVVIEIN